MAAADLMLLHIQSAIDAASYIVTSPILCDTRETKDLCGEFIQRIEA